jgi:GNAT superfamily N-acetyltransferase
VLKLLAFSAADFSEYLARAPAAYAVSLEYTGLTKDEALARAEAQFNALLPKGIETPDAYLFNLLNESGAKVGFIWFNLSGPAHARRAWLYDIEVYESFRGKGFGRAAMQAFEGWCREHEVVSLGLNVFSYNTVAKKLYESLGYEVRAMNMEKKLV